MSRPSVITNPAFQQNTSPVVGFNIVAQTNSFQSIFNAKPLNKTESTNIENLLAENVQSGISSEEQIRHASELKRITSEIKAIGKQGIVLMGERVQRARDLLKPYKDGTFTKWLASTFGTRKTGYNMLSYYELYTALPHEDLRDRLKQLPQRTAYILASRGGTLNIKAEIISEHYNCSHDELVTIIQEKLPIASKDGRTKKNSNERLISVIYDSIQKLQSEKKSLTETNRVEIFRIRELIDKLL